MNLPLISNTFLKKYINKQMEDVFLHFQYLTCLLLAVKTTFVGETDNTFDLEATLSTL